MTVKDLAYIEYHDAWELQKMIFEEVKSGKTPDTLLLCEHPHVYTIGKSGNPENLLVTTAMLDNIGANYYKTDRGGDITYHGPGQLVAYPIINLSKYNLSLREYIQRLEEAVIKTIQNYNIIGSSKKGATGVWIDNNSRKICAIGVRASRNTTMHGLALNVNTDLQYFKYINPCGFKDKQVTSIAYETGNEIEMQELKNTFVKNFNSLFAK